MGVISGTPSSEHVTHPSWLSFTFYTSQRWFYRVNSETLLDAKNVEKKYFSWWLRKSNEKFDKTKIEMETRYEDGESVADAMEAGTDAIDDSSDGVEAQQMSPSQMVLDHQLNTKGREQDQTCHRSASIKTQSNIIRNNYRLDPDVPNKNVSIIKIESDRMSSHVSIKHKVGSVTSDGIKPHHSHLAQDGCSFNKLIILNKPNLSFSNKSSVSAKFKDQSQSITGWT